MYVRHTPATALPDSADTFDPVDHFNPPLNIWLDELNCTGTETTIDVRMKVDLMSLCK